MHMLNIRFYASAYLRARKSFLEQAYNIRYVKDDFNICRALHRNAFKCDCRSKGKYENDH